VKPGNELDRLVALKVLGWKLCRTADHISPGYSYWDRGEDPGRIVYEKDTPRFSTVIRKAWDVAEYLHRRRGFWVKVLWMTENPVTRNKGDEIRVEFESELEDGPRGDAFGVSLPHAICLAALEVVEQSLEESESVETNGC